MAEESQNLVPEHVPGQSVVDVGNREPRRMSCNKGSLVTALTVLVAVLVAGQAVMAFFITQQNSRIQDLDRSTKNLQLKAMMKELPGSPPVPSKQKMRTFNIPMALKLYDGSEMNMNDLEQMAQTGNKMEDAAKYMLLRGNPLRKYPSLNGTILENLRELKKTLTDQEWMTFDAWMQQWYLFFLVQNTEKPAEPLPSTKNTAVTGAPLMTECQTLSRIHTMTGTYKPQCEQNGDFKPLQCWPSTGFCWCVYHNGTEIPETRTRSRLDCSSIMQPEDPMFLESITSSDADFGPFD
ncbi:CD74 molecule, major histocompatibility complex, class II invariant chain isoform X1 [Xenopus laevis]|uniref:CD74 molecule, major histocompatibility complex, class II invariant chain isoform X1 n=1 Tax=Xenopus laevis TaxID=8355 RepID=A0A8J0UMU4_XENLA|nr:CD74 molecule, major histocompatibility complex, class II invariant chain isoform X1 [Xenopus laevis]